MSRTLKLTLFAAVAWMTLVALADFAWLQGAFPELPAPGPNTRMPPLVVFQPIWIAVAAVFFDRRLARKQPRIADRTRRFLEGSLRAATAICVAMQGLFAYIEVTDATMNLDLIRRFVMAVTGLWLVFYGNGLAKLDPPSGEGALPPGIWARLQLRVGWMTVVWGLATLVCALTLPKALLQPVLIATAAIVLAGLVVVYRMSRRGRAT